MSTEKSAAATETYCRSFGHGPRKVLALHCTIAHSGAWRGLATLMEDEATFVAPDMPSHGRSPDWDRQGDYQDHCVAAAEPFLSERMDVIGHSFGATIALRLAVARPDLVRSLTLIEPVYFAVCLQDAPDLMADHAARAGPFSEALESGDEELGARLFNRMWSDGGPKWPDLPAATRAAMVRSIHVVPAQHESLFDDRPGMLQPGVLDRVTMPCLLLSGGNSAPVMPAINDGLARRLPDAECQIVKDAGHMLPITHAKATAKAFRALLARAPA